LSQAYDLSSNLILKFAEVDVTVGFLMQIDKLVQLLESPIFIQLRLHLLEINSKSHGDLLKSLYGLLMLLPQSQAYKTLSDRLTTVSSLHMHIGLASANNRNVINDSNEIAIQNDKNIVNNILTTTTSSTSTIKNDSDTIVDEAVIDTQESLLLHFEKIQEKHTEFRLSLLKQKSLVNPNNNVTTSQEISIFNNNNIV
jgi:vacuole morphology and inheritance protein 14